MQLCQIALCTSDLPQSVRLYTEGLGFAEAGTRVLWGERIAQIQRLGDDSAFTISWLVGRQDMVQLELFHHTVPPQRARLGERGPADLGWVRFGVVVPDFDAVVERLAGLGVEPLSEPRAVAGLRRLAFTDPHVGCVVEVFEEGLATPGGIRPRFYDLVPAVVYVTLSVADLAEARRFYVDALGLEEEPDTVLHEPDDEVLWGLDAVQRDSFVARGGDVYLEVVQYDEPSPRPLPDDHLLSDQGFMNVAVGTREGAELSAAYERILAGGYTANSPAPRIAGGTYVNDGLGTTAELLVAPREFDAGFGFAPQPLFRRQQSWPQPSVGPATVPSE
jgi:catechol 2,3-dioxygenase-like lactoylglutathione lyase family enzyme